MLAKIVTDAINPFFDRGLDQRVFEAESKWLDEAQGRLNEQIDQDLLVDLRRQAEQKLAALQREIDDLNRNLRLATEDEIYLPKVSIPEPKIDPNLHGKPLVSSAWLWADQTRALIAKKAYSEAPGP